jgi:hypothetical protein
MRLFSLCLFVLFFTSTIFAGVSLQVHEKIPVYLSPKKQKVLFHLKKGNKVSIATKSYGRWRKIQFQHKNKSYSAWIKTSDVKKSKIVFDEEAKAQGLGKRKSKIGFSVNALNTQMGEQQVVDESGLKSNFEKMSGSSSYFGFVFDTPYKKANTIRLFFSLYEVSVSGKGNYEGSGSETLVSVDQKFWSLSALYKANFSTSSKFWWSVGGGIDSGQEVDLTIDGTKESLTGDALPFYSRVIGGIGYDFSLTESLSLESGLHVSYVLNADKTIVPIDFSLVIKREI